jgi:hypothetical protein
MLVCCSQIFAQAGADMGGVTGTVKDPTGALVQKAQCTLTNENTGVTEKTFSTSAGAYEFPYVRVGTYNLKVTATGFKVYVLNDIVVHLGTTVTADVSMQMGSATAEVTVTSAAPLLQAQDSSLGMTVDASSLNELPITGGSNGRGYLTLLSVAPGAQPVNSQLIHGVQSGALDIRLNGTDDYAFGVSVIQPIPDTIQEFKLESGNNTADIGISYGSVVSMETKVGTNKFQGKAWEYNENDMYNANDYFNKLHQLVTNSAKTPNRPTRSKENSFGALYGGPVIIPHIYNGHNKTFFMIDFETTYFANAPSYTGTVPTSAMQSSGFSNMSDTLTLSKSTAKDGLGRTFQAGTMFDPATTRWIPCGSIDPITGLTAGCASGQNGVVTNPTINGGAKVAVVRDPFLTGAGGCPSLTGTTNFVSAFAGGGVPTSCLNQLSAGRIDPNAVALLKLFPAPNQTITGTYASDFYEVLPSPQTTHKYDVRIDQTFNNKDSAFLTWGHYNNISQPTPPFQGVLEGGTNVGFWTVNPVYLVSLTETHMFNPGLINVANVSFSRNWNVRLDPGAIDTTPGIPAQFGIQGIPATLGGLPQFSLGSSISSIGSRQFLTWQKVGQWMVSDNLTKIIGKHELKFGGEDWIQYWDIAQPANAKGTFSYGQYSNLPGGGDGGAGIADFLLQPTTNIASGPYASPGVNALSTGSVSGNNATGHVLGGVNGYTGNNWHQSNYHGIYGAFFASDSWKITPSLTASLGMRWDSFAPYSSNGGQQANFWMGGPYGNVASGSTYYIAHDGCGTPRSNYFNGLLAYDGIAIVCQPNNTVNTIGKGNWSPRTGLAYRIRPNLVARAGAGISYGAYNGVGYGGTLGTNYPFGIGVQQGLNTPYTPQLLSNATSSSVTATMENTFGFVNMENPTQAYIQVGSLALFGKPYHFKTPYEITLDFAVQWQFTNHDSIQATYVGQLGHQLETANPYQNAPRQALTSGTPVATSCATTANPYCATSPLMPDGTTTIPFPNLAPNAEIENTEQVQNYESGEAVYQHQFAGGFSLNANYTFARCWADTQGGQQNEGGPANGRAPWVVGFGGYRADYDRCSSTSANIFKAYGEFGLPFGKGAHWAAHANTVEDAIIGGWKLDPIWISTSGLLANVSCQGTNGQGANPAFNGPWFQTSNTAWSCNAPTVPGQHLYGPGPNDHPRTRITGFWNSSAFTAPQYAVQTNGQQDFSPWGVRGNQIYGSGWYNFDLSTHKYFKTSENTKLEVVAEAFNVFNHVELSNPGTSNYTTPSQESLTTGFGTFTGDVHGPRTWEFAAKFNF